MDEYLAVVKNFAINFEPIGWMKCDGRLLEIRRYNALYALLGVNFGGDGNNTFGIPDLREFESSVEVKDGVAVERKTEKRRDWKPGEVIPMICVEQGIFPCHQ